MEVWDAFVSELEKRQLFDSIAVTNTGCMGPCSYGATVLVYPEGVMYGQVKPSDVAEIFDSHLVDGKPVDRLRMPSEVWG
jgi:(2Fe-2S) ferredoxin